MQQTITLKLPPLKANSRGEIFNKIIEYCKCSPEEITGYHIKKRSIDARGKDVKILLTVHVFINEPFIENTYNGLLFKPLIKGHRKVVIVGAGPAGIFCALQLLELGLKPVILERGKDVKARRRDLALLNKYGIVHENSNYCFGEGGAGTYSDGKLYTRSNKRGDINRILNIFRYYGAEEEIVYDAHPHIGTNKLPQIIVAMREAIVAAGGEVLFEKKVNKIMHNDQKIISLQCADSTVHTADAFVLATGHSARDIFYLLHDSNILIESKPLAIGIRIEHPQELVNTIQFGKMGAQVQTNVTEEAYLPPASYSLVQQVDGRGVFSFCMCPGGIVAAAATAPGEVVVNGWSPSKRNNPFANSGIVVEVRAEDVLKVLPHLQADDPFLFLEFQMWLEHKCFVAAGSDLSAPAQRMIDFVDKQQSKDLPRVSYVPGVTSVPLNEVLPHFMYHALAEAFKLFGKKLKGFYTNQAVVIATESRTSSPVRIPRDSLTLSHPQVINLFPCGEGAGYAGGIVSAAMDGESVALAIYKSFNE